MQPARGQHLVDRSAWADADWDDLSRDQQQVLSDFRDRWQDLPQDRRAKLVGLAERWRAMPPEQRAAVEARWRDIKPLPPEARDALRQRWEVMSPEERRRMAREMQRLQQGQDMQQPARLRN